MLNFVFFPLFLASSAACVYIYDLADPYESIRSAAMTELAATVLLGLICTFAILTIGHLGSTISRLETVRNQQLVNSLAAQGVKFDVCGNTLDTIERETGKRPAINPNAVEVAAGVPALLELAEKNYTIVRP